MCLGGQHLLQLLIDAVNATTHVLVLLNKCVISFQIREILQNYNNLLKITFSPVKNDHSTYSSRQEFQFSSTCYSPQTIQGQILLCMIMRYSN